MYGKACFRLKMFSNRLNTDVIQQARNENTVYLVRTPRLSNKQNVLGKTVRRGHADKILGYWKIYCFGFSWKICNYR